jgi:hypothetical protein
MRYSRWRRGHLEVLGFALQQAVTMKFQVPCISMIWILPTPSIVDVEELVFAIVE